MFAQEAEAGASVAAGWFLEQAWLIPLIPSVAFAVIIFFGKKLGKPVANGAYIGIAIIVLVALSGFFSGSETAVTAASSCGPSVLHGPHHVAQKSTITGTVLLCSITST